MKILIFGGSGMLGRELVRALAEHDVVMPSRAAVDISDTSAVERIFDEEKPDFGINAAALIDVNAIEKNPAPAWRINAEGAGVVARAAAARAVPQLFVSSSYVFADSVIAYPEDAERRPATEYGKTKAEGEDFVRTCGSSSPWYVARTSWIYSPERDTFVDEVAQTLLRGESFDASVQRGNPTYARDFATAVAAHFIDGDAESGIYHLVSAGERGASRYEIAQEIARILDIPEINVLQKDFPPAATRPSVTLKNTKLPPLPPWKESLRSYLMYKYRQNSGPSI